MEEKKKKPAKRSKTRAQIKLAKEMEADRRVRELEKVLAANVKKEAQEEELLKNRDPEEILNDEKFRPGKLTWKERIALWSGERGLISLICAFVAFVLLMVCFGLVVATRGAVSFGTAVIGIFAVLLCLYGIGFAIAALRKKERKQFFYRAGLVLNSCFLAVFFGIYILGAL